MAGGRISICISWPPSFGKQLVSHTDAEDGQFLVLHCLADMLHGSIAGIRVARAVGDEQPVELHPSIIIVPGNANHFHVTFQQAADDVMLDAAIHKGALSSYRFLRCNG